MKKSLLSALVLAAAASPSLANLTFYDPFDYSDVGTTLSGHTDLAVTPNQQWFKSPATSSTSDPVIAAGSLSYPGLAASAGNSALLTNTSTASRVQIGSYAEGSTLYYSLTMQVTDLTGLTNTSTGSFFTGLNYQSPANNPGMTDGSQSSMGPICIHKDPNSDAYNLGIAFRDAPGGSTRIFGTTPFTTADTLFVVVKFVLGAGNQDDAAYLYINPDASTFGHSEPAAATVASANGATSGIFDFFYKTDGTRATETTSGLPLTTIESMILRNNSVEPKNIQVDDLRVGTTWADVTPAAVAAIAGDVNGDGVVDLGDINYITARWLNTGSDGDANGDNTIDLGDINFVTAHWLNTSAPAGIAAVPEPASLSLLGLGAVGLLARRRK